MTKYVDLVLVKFDEEGKTHLYQAPAFSYLQPDDMVRCDYFGGELAKVVQSITVDMYSMEYRFIAAVARLDEPPRKVLSKVRYSELVYKEDSDEQGESDRTDNEGH